MKNNKHKILILSDLRESDSIMLKNTVSLAKMIDGEIHFLTVKKPTEIVEKESQLSAMRSINQEHFASKKSMLKLIESVSKTDDIHINNTLSYGNVKQEIGKFIKEYQPDIVVLGKRKSKLLNLMGDNMAQYIYKKHKGAIMISSDENVLKPNNKLSLGLFNDADAGFHFTKDLIPYTQKPIKSFKVVKNSNATKSSNPNNKETIEYVFEENDNTLKNLSNYLLKNNINLLCVNRENESKRDKTNITNIIDNLNVSLLLTGKTLKFQ